MQEIVWSTTVFSAANKSRYSLEPVYTPNSSNYSLFYSPDLGLSCTIRVLGLEFHVELVKVNERVLPADQC